MKRDAAWFADKIRIVANNPHLLKMRIKYGIDMTRADILSFFGRYDYPYKIIFLAGMAMGGSTWMKNLLTQIPGYYIRKNRDPYEVHYNQNITDAAFQTLPKYGYTIFKTHLNPTQKNIDVIRKNGVRKVLVTHRDLRDIAVSRYHRLLVQPKFKDSPDYIDYKKLGKEEGLNHSIRTVAESYTGWIEGWYRHYRENEDSVLIIRFEDMKKDTKKEFKRVLDFYQISLDENLIDTIISNAKGKGDLKSNIEAAKVLPFGVSSNFRAGTTGHWRDELNEAQIEICKKYLSKTLVLCGYEKDDNW